MPLRVNNNILNQRGTPAFYSDVFSARPTFGYAGRVFISTDTGQIFEDTGTAWSLIADAGVGGGTLASVCANGNTTATGMTITAGNLGINTATAGAPLDIHCTGTAAQFNGTGTNNAYVFFQNAGTNKWRLGNTYSAGANSFDLYNVGLANTALSVNSSYNVLQLNGNLAIKQSTGIFNISGYSAIACDNGGFFFNVGGANNAYFNLIGLTASRTFTFPDVNGTLALTSQIPAASQWTTLGSNIYYNTGNVGIGTSSPSSFSGYTVTSISGTNGGVLDLMYNGTSQMRISAENGSNYIAGVTNAPLIIWTNGAEKMRITSGGNVLIGTTTNNGGALQVNGDIQSIGASAILLTQARDLSNKYGFYGTVGSTMNFYSDNNGIVGQFSASTGIYTPTSDINKKKDFEISNIGLNAILSLKPTLYRMQLDNDNTEKQLGFIAQEVKEFIPQAYIENNEFIGLNFNPIIAALVKSIQELNEKLVRNNIN